MSSTTSGTASYRRPGPTSPALLAALSGLALGLGLIVAIGARKAFVLRQGLRLEHVAAVVAVCALSLTLRGLNGA